MKKVSLGLFVAIAMVFTGCESYTALTEDQIKEKATHQVDSMKAQLTEEFMNQCNADMEAKVAAKLQELQKADSAATMAAGK